MWENNLVIDLVDKKRYLEIGHVIKFDNCSNVSTFLKHRVPEFSNKPSNQTKDASTNHTMFSDDLMPVLISGPVHTAPFSNENVVKLIRFSFISFIFISFHLNFFIHGNPFS